MMPVLLCVAYMGNVEFMQMLLQTGKVDVNQQDNEV